MKPKELSEYIQKNPDATQRQIAECFGYTQSAIRFLIKRYGIAYQYKIHRVDSGELRQFIQNNPTTGRKELAARFGVHPASVSQMLKTHGISHEFPHHHARIQLRRDELTEYLRQHPGLTQKQIAEHFGFSRSSVRNIMKRFGIQYAKRQPKYCQLSESALRKYILNHPDAAQRQIAAHFKYDQSTISDILKRYGIPYKSKCPRNVNRK